MKPNVAAAIAATRTPGAILAARYTEEVETLLRDPIILSMTANIPAGFDLDSIPVTAALHEYNARGGQNAQSIGGPLWAIKALRHIIDNA